MTRTTAQTEAPAPRKRTQVSKDTSEALAGDKRTGRPASTGTRKRVNIDSLASRLGPEVVRRLEALITPGKKEMPSFAARQAIQKQYNVNRRHIYDWYHTKGLRVTKEEPRGEGAQSTPARPRREMRQRGGPSSTPDMTFDASEDGHSSFPSPNLLLTPAQHGTGPFHAYGEFSVSERCNDAPLNNWYYYYGPPAPGHPDIQNKQPFMTSASTTPIIPATVRTESPDASESILASRPVGAPGNAHNSGRTVADNQEENVEPGLPPDLSGLLSGSERQALYDSLSGILGPPNGIEESVGTYKAYMQRQNQIYYESLLPSPTSSSIAGYYTSAAYPSVLRASHLGLDYAPLPQQNNPGLALSTPYSMHPIRPPHAQVPQPQRDELRKQSGRSTPAHLNAGPAPLVHPGTPSSVGVDASRFGTPHGYAHPGGALELGDIIESPLLRSRNPSTYGHGHALYAVNPAHAQAQAHHPWYPAQAFADPTGYSAVNPVYRPATIGHVPIWQSPYMPPVPVAISAHSSSAQWERGNFTAMLQDAIHTSAETTVSPGSSQEANKDKRLDSTGQRSGQTRTDSRGA